jgi:AcrR family transcriptional regulator
MTSPAKSSTTRPAVTRRAQAERSAEMTERVLDATLDLIHEKGMAEASTVAIAKRAGVSRGAILHHYPQRFDLITAAVDHLLETETEKIRKVSAAFAGGEVDLDALIDYLWGMFSGRLFMITLDYLAVARTDEDLRRHLGPVSLKFNRALDEIWATFFRLNDRERGRIDITLNLTLCLLRGMGVQTVLQHRDPAYFQELIASWKGMLAGVLRQGPTPAER